MLIIVTIASFSYMAGKNAVLKYKLEQSKKENIRLKNKLNDVNCQLYGRIDNNVTYINGGY